MLRDRSPVQRQSYFPRGPRLRPARRARRPRGVARVRPPVRGRQAARDRRGAPGRARSRCWSRRGTPASGLGTRARPRSMTISQSQICSSSLRMCEDEHRPLAVADRANELAHLVDSRRVEAVGGLVQDEQCGVPEQSGGDTQALLHAERVVAEPVRASPAESDEVEHLGNAARVVAAQGGQGGGSRCRSSQARRRVLRSAPRLGRGRRPGRPRSRRAPSQCPTSGAPARAASPSWSSCRRRSAR